MNLSPKLKKKSLKIVCVFVCVCVHLECQKKKKVLKSPREMKLFLFEADTSA